MGLPRSVQALRDKLSRDPEECSAQSDALCSGGVCLPPGLHSTAHDNGIHAAPSPEQVDVKDNPANRDIVAG